MLSPIGIFSLIRLLIMLLTISPIRIINIVIGIISNLINCDPCLYIIKTEKNLTYDYMEV